jgi:hypothetical protein
VAHEGMVTIAGRAEDQAGNSRRNVSRWGQNVPVVSRAPGVDARRASAMTVIGAGTVSRRRRPVSQADVLVRPAPSSRRTGGRSRADRRAPGRHLVPLVPV